MKKLYFIPALLCLLLAFCFCGGKARDAKSAPIEMEHYPIPIEQIKGRDPFLYADEESKTYYLTFRNNPHFKMYSSKDLKNWKDEGNVFTANEDFWGKQDFWAPDLYEYKGKYYIFATFSDLPTINRGTSILVADNVTGPYKPLVNHAVTPSDWMCLDGSLFIDDEDKPWIIFCKEWLQAIDGEVYAQQLSDDLKETIGDPVLLLNASTAPWTSTIKFENVTGYVTDAPFLYKTDDGRLQMIWSSFDKNRKYAMGIAESESGTLAGPWKHLPEQLNHDDGGHAMIFRGFDGHLYISYHTPNGYPEKPKITRIKETNETIVIQ